MKHLLLALLFSVVSFSSMSQESKYPINYQIVYKHSYVKDSLNRDKKEEETMELLVGDNVTFFQAYNKGIRDSIIAAEDIDHNKGISYAIQSKTPFDLAYTIFHQNNMFTTRDSYISTLGREKDNSYYQEKIVLHWDLLPDTDSIHGLLVQKAQCKIGDLSWTAFFTPEISLPYGPYKFAGLPGLILKVEDNKGYFSFVMTNIVQKTAKMQAFLRQKH